MRAFVFAFLALALAACVATTAPTGNNGGKLYGSASCAASTRGSCPALTGKTYYSNTGGEAYYFAPNGDAYTWQRTKIVRARWFVDRAGLVVRFEGGGGTISSAFGVPIAQLGIFQRFDGDFAGMRNAFAKTSGSVSIALQPYDNFNQAASRLRAV